MQARQGYGLGGRIVLALGLQLGDAIAAAGINLAHRPISSNRAFSSGVASRSPTFFCSSEELAVEAFAFSAKNVASSGSEERTTAAVRFAPTDMFSSHFEISRSLTEAAW
jgi:hypothetical protein